MTDQPESVPSAESVDRPGRKRSRLGQPVPAETVANYGAARAFLLGEWFGASMMVASFTLLYLFGFAPSHAGVLPGVLSCLGLLGIGTWVYVRSRTYYRRIAFDYAPKWHMAAVIVAGSAGIFWLLFVFLLALTWFGVPVLPNK